MVVIGFNLTKVLVERKKTITGKVSIRTNIDIKEINKEKLEMIKDKEVLSFDFQFIIDYDPEVAKLIFEGNILVALASKEAKEILNKWKKKELPEDVRLNIFNTILSRCSIEALSMEEKMGLPTHFPLPKFTKEQKK
jgi:hypothetical protein